MKQIKFTFLLGILMSMIGIKAFAHDIAVANADGVIIYYNFINNNTELAVTYQGNSISSSGCYSGSVVIPNDLIYNGSVFKITRIDSHAFINCSNLTTVKIPNSVTSIGTNAFKGCGIISVTIPNSVTSIASSAFMMCNSLISITIPNSLTIIETEVFCNCSSLISVKISDSVTSIKSMAFSGCNALTSLTMGNRVSYIENMAFRGCSSLTELTIPKSVKKIGTQSFYACKTLNKIVSLIEEPFEISGKSVTYPTFSPTTFENATLYVPVGTLSKYKSTRGWKDFTNIVEGIPSGIKSVENEQTAESLETGNWFTLDGRRLNGKPTKKGIYIVNGKKVIIK